MLTLESLISSERELAEGDGATYRRVLADEALVVVPGMVLDAEACIKAMDASPGWDSVSLTDAHLITASGECASVVYTFAGARGDSRYKAILSSTYVLRDGAPRLVLHQQTPV